MYSPKEILIKEKLRYGYTWNTVEANNCGVPIYCNVYIRDTSGTTHRIDTVAIHRHGGSTTFHAHYWFHVFENMILKETDNLDNLAQWVNSYVLSKAGIKHIFQRFTTFDNYKLFDSKVFNKNEIIYIVFNSTESDDDRV